MAVFFRRNIIIYNKNISLFFFIALAVCYAVDAYSSGVKDRYTYLYENGVESVNYEIRKVPKSSKRANILYDRSKKTYIINSSIYHDYEKMNSKGYIIDSFIHKADSESRVSFLSSTGVFYDYNYYIDWAITGDKFNKKYHKIINYDELNDKAVKKYFDKAEIVDFSKELNKEVVRFYLYIKKRWLVLESKNQFKNIEKNNFDISIISHLRKNNDRLVVMEILKFDSRSESEKIYMQDFSKIGHEPEPAIVKINTNWYGDYGEGYFRVKHDNEVLNFKAAVSGDSPEFFLYIVPEKIRDEDSDKLSLFNAGSRDKVENGLYVIREKIILNPKAIEKYESKGVSFGNYLFHDLKFEWQPVFKGFNGEPLSVININYFNGKNYSQNSNNKSSIGKVPENGGFSEFKTTPEVITFSWKVDKNSQDKNNHEKYQFYFDEKIYEVNNSGEKITFKLKFSDVEILEVFQRWGLSGGSMRLQIRMDAVDNNSGIFSVHVVTDTAVIPLRRINIKSTENDFATIERDYMLNRRFELEGLRIFYEAALKNADELSYFFWFSRRLTEDARFAKNFRYQMSDYTTKLMINAIKKSDVKQAKLIFNNYVNNVFPRAGQSIKTTDVASMGLVVCLAEKDTKMCDLIFEKLLPDLDVNKLDNEVLLYNLACYYSINKEKDSLLATVKQALNHGKKSSSFMRDSDFKTYWKDPEFLNLLKTGEKK